MMNKDKGNYNVYNFTPKWATPTEKIERIVEMQAKEFREEIRVLRQRCDHLEYSVGQLRKEQYNMQDEETE